MQWFVRRFALSMLFVASFLVACPLSGQAQDLDDLLEKAGAAQASGKYADAADLYRRATALSPATPELWSNLGVMEYMAGQMDKSAASFKHALQLNSSLFAPMLFLGKDYVQMGKPALALPYLNHAHTLRPNDIEVLLALGKASADMNKQQEASSFYADAARTAPENTSAWFGLGVSSLDVIATEGRQLAASQAQSLWARSLYADELLAQGRPLEATDTYKAVFAAATPAQKSTLARTLDLMQRRSDLFPLPPSSAEALQRLNEQLQSESDKAVSSDCSTPASPLQDAACAYWLGDYDRSVAKARQALHQTPQSAEALYWSIKANERMAVAALGRFEELDPQSVKNFVMVGDLYRFQRQMDSALTEYKKALAIDPDDESALMGTATAYLANGNLDEAAATDRTALARHPLDPQLNLLMAEILTANNEYDQAKPYLEKCVDAPPDLQPRVHLLLGRVASEDGDTDEAIHQFEIALPGDKDGSIHYQLSRLYRKAGKLAQAQKTEAEAKVLIQRRDANAAVAVREAIGTNP